VYAVSQIIAYLTNTDAERKLVVTVNAKHGWAESQTITSSLEVGVGITGGTEGLKGGLSVKVGLGASVTSSGGRPFGPYFTTNAYHCVCEKESSS
jgi:hypothetical protein